MIRSPVFGCLQNPSMVDFPGRMAAVFFVSGCNFHCGFCHNASLMGTPRPGMNWDELSQRCQRFSQNWIQAAVITGGEPTLSPTLPELIRFFRKLGWAVKLDTNGSNPDLLAQCLPDLDYVAMDVKTSLAEYPSLAGWTDTEAICRSLHLLREQARAYEFRSTLIEGVHHADILAAMLPLVEGAVRYVLQPFVPADTLPGKAFRTIPRTSAGFMENAGVIFHDHVQELIVRGA